MKTAEHYRNALKANTSEYWHGGLAYEVFSNRNGALWREIEDAGLAAEVRDLLRADLPGSAPPPPPVVVPVASTYDGRPVYAADAELPEGAHGWTLCKVVRAAYTSWLPEESQPAARADLDDLERRAAKVTTHRKADMLFGATFAGRTLDDRRNSWIIAEYAELWPLRLEK
jgi:hypothetical protein